MRIFKEEPKIKFINKRFYAFALSGLIILAGLVMFVTKGFNMGIDFSGGTMIEVSMQKDTTVRQLRDTLAKINLGDAQITRISGENKFFIKTLASLKKLNISREKEINFGVEVLIAYFYKKSIEMKKLRTVIIGKENGLSPDEIKVRLGYVG